MQIPILGGVYSDQSGDFRIAYPVNLRAIPMDSGISKGYLRPIDGLVKQGDGPGNDRGGINWNGTLYRVMGTKLVTIDAAGLVVEVGDVGIGGPCTFDYSFDRLAVTSGGRLYYVTGGVLTQVTDADLGTALDVVWVDGYFMTTDGEYLVVTELTDPFAVSPLKYGSSEIDPDPVNSVMKLRNEIYAVNRYTIEVFQNVGGSGFPFQRITGAQVQKGSVGTMASCVFAEAIAFVGSGRNESTGIYLGAKAQVQKISSVEIDRMLASYPDLSTVRIDTKSENGLTSLWVHLPDRTLVYDLESSAATGGAVWHVMTSGDSGFSRYPATGLVWAYNRWNAADPVGAEFGYLDDSTSKQWGESARWEFSTPILYNEGTGAIFHSIELVALTGHVELGDNPTIGASYSFDGETWSQERFISAGKQGVANKRLVWYQQGQMRDRRIQRFRGDSSAFLTFTRLDARVEPLGV